MAQTIGNMIINVSANTVKLQKDMKRAKDLTTAFKVGVIAMGVAVTASVTKIIDVGLEYNRALESTQDGIRSVLASTSSLITTEGKLITNQQRLNMAREESVNIMADLEALNKRTPVDLKTTANMYKAMLPSMRSVGVSQTDLLYLTEKLAIAGKNQGLSNEQLLSGIDNIATGTVEVNSEFGRMLKIFGLTNEVLKKTTDKGKLFREVFNNTMISDTAELKLSNFNQAFGSLAGKIVIATGVQTLYNKSLKATTELMNVISDSMGTSKLDSAKKTTLELERSTYQELIKQKKVKEDILNNLIKPTLTAQELGVAISKTTNKDEQEQYRQGLRYIGTQSAILDIKKKIAGISTEAKTNTDSLGTAPKVIAADPAVEAAKIKAIKDTISANKELFESIENLKNANIPYREEILNINRAFELNNLALKKNKISKEEYSQVQDSLIAQSQIIADATDKEYQDGLESKYINEEKKKSIEKLMEAYQAVPTELEKIHQATQLVTESYNNGVISLDEYSDHMALLQKKQAQMTTATADWGAENTAAVNMISSAVENAGTSMFKSMIEGTLEVKEAFKNMASTIMAELFRIYVMKKIVGLAVAAFSGPTATEALTPDASAGYAPYANADGGVYNNNSPKPKAFAKGGAFTNSIVSKPTLFNGGAGLMGEAGPEAIMPLQRIGGKLGIIAKAESPIVNVNVSNNAPGTEARAKTDTDGNIEITINRIIDDINRGGGVSDALQSKYGIGRV